MYRGTEIKITTDNRYPERAKKKKKKKVILKFHTQWRYLSKMKANWSFFRLKKKVLGNFIASKSEL